MVCNRCNQTIPDNSVFCTNCGAQFEQELEDTGVLADDFGNVNGGVNKYAGNPYNGGDNSHNGGGNAYSGNGNSQNANGGTNSAYTNPNFDNGYPGSGAVSNTNQNGYVAYNQAQKPTMKECYIKFWENTTNYSDRARRSEYWNVVLANLLISLVTSFTGLGVLYSIASFPQMLSLTVRRLHDIGKEWYHMFFYLIPIAGPIIVLVWLCKDSQVGTNNFGPNPKGINATNTYNNQYN